MCRGGRMFAPTKVYRRWHRRVNVAQRRYAVVSAIAASGVPALVQARGHIIDQISEVPLVIADKIESLTKTKEAVAFLKRANLWDDIEKVYFIKSKLTFTINSIIFRSINRNVIVLARENLVIDDTSKSSAHWSSTTMTEELSVHSATFRVLTCFLLTISIC
jgi:ribosomal protein L4